VRAVRKKRSEMSCSCDGEPAEIWEETERKARKEWKCYECGEKIEKGETYTQIKSLICGYWSNHRVCEYCMHDWGVLVKAGHCMELGGLTEAWAELWETPAPVRIKKDDFTGHGAWSK
jgi:hypothetical protein